MTTALLTLHRIRNIMAIMNDGSRTNVSVAYFMTPSDTIVVQSLTRPKTWKEPVSGLTSAHEC
jgi:hypothetical protein